MAVLGAVLGFIGVGRMGGPMASWPKPAFGEVEPILGMFGKIFYTGEKPGLAQSAKLANNPLAATA